MTASMSMPMSWAALGFSATARIARPALVRRTIQPRAAARARLRTSVAILLSSSTRLPRRTDPERATDAGRARELAPKRSSAMFTKMRARPMLVSRALIGGAARWRRGRKATRSIP